MRWNSWMNTKPDRISEPSNSDFNIYTLSITGIGIKNGDYRTENLVPINSSLAMRVKTMNAIGYNGQRFYTGLQLISSFYYLPLDKDLKSGVLEGRSALYIGYRFGKRNN